MEAKITLGDLADQGSGKVLMGPRLSKGAIHLV